MSLSDDGVLSIYFDVINLVREKLDHSEPFTNACISHPLIKKDSTVRHRDVKKIIDKMWQNQELEDPNLQLYLRTTISVFPEGPGRPTAQAYLYYPSDGYDPHSFSAVSRVLIRGDQSDTNDTKTSVSGGTSTRKCAVQKAEATLNIPRCLIKEAGWVSGDKIYVMSANSNGMIGLMKSSIGNQVIDKEGRLRLHGSNATMFRGKDPVAMLITSISMVKHIQVVPSSQLQSQLKINDDLKVDDNVDDLDDDLDSVSGADTLNSVWDNLPV